MFQREREREREAMIVFFIYLVVVHWKVVLAHRPEFGFSRWPRPLLHCPERLHGSTAVPGSECGTGIGGGR